VVLAPVDSLRRDALDAVLRQAGTRALRDSILLLVPDRVDRARLAHHRGGAPANPGSTRCLARSSFFSIIFAGVSVLGFAASRWGSGDRTSLEEWGLAGRGFGTIVTWFLLGGDLYTAYTFVALPAFLYGAGAIGFFAVPYTTLAFIFFFRGRDALFGSWREIAAT